MPTLPSSRQTKSQVAGAGGPAMESLAEQAKTWYVKQRDFLVKELISGGYPYGAVRLSPQEQYQKFLQMTPQDWQNLYASLMQLHRGKPDAPFLVEKSLGAYVRLMRNLGRVYGGQVGTPLPPELSQPVIGP